MMNRSQPAPESLYFVWGAMQAPVERAGYYFSAILFLSGIGALLFETLWLRLSGLAFGNSVWAAALILSSFMAGLALGMRSPRHREFGDGGRFIFTPCWRCSSLCLVAQSFLVFRRWANCCDPCGKSSGIISHALLGLRFVVSFLILPDPDNGDGPDAAGVDRRSMLRQTNFGRAIGFLYGSNTLGAVAGAVLGEGYLIAAFGLRGTRFGCSCGEFASLQRSRCWWRNWRRHERGHS